MYFEELIIIIVFVVGIYLYRNYKGENVGKYVVGQVQGMYDRFAPYSFKVVREKTKQLGQEYTVRQYTIIIINSSKYIISTPFYSPNLAIPDTCVVGIDTL